MADQYIPAGRTSAVENRGVVYQLQTEYVRHPQVRVVTTIFNDGKVIQKVEKRLEFEVASIDEMHRVEDLIKGQHREISRIIRNIGCPTPGPAASPFPAGSAIAQLSALDGIDRVYRISLDGKIDGDKGTTAQFRKMFKHVIKELPQMLKIFTSVPGNENCREEGIYEIEPNRILLVSTGKEYYLLLINGKQDYPSLAPQICDILNIV